MLWSTPALAGAALLLPTVAAAPKFGKAANLSTKAQAGAHVIYSYSGSSIPSELYTLASQGAVGGIILFGDNVDSNTASEIEQLQSTYKKSASYAGYPLIIVTDQEGGEVARLPGGPTASEYDIGQSNNVPSAASSAGVTAATACAAYNVNGNLAPVLGVYRSPGDFLDQYQRSYSTEQYIAKEAGSAFILAQQAHGVIATAKHFPGLGAATASEDTDVEPVTLNVSLEDLRTIDEVPFVGAVAAGVDMVMASWAVYPAMDTLPAGLSPSWIGSELRSRLGYTGVTITDAIEAGALQAYGSNETRALKAMNAGMDIILASVGDPSQGSGIVSAIETALGNGGLSQSAFTSSTSRIMSLRSKL
ncbi:putative glycosyl hydrolase [Neohortaea acidophila]|uniref:Putative glycosyl hydrolase n=1 Tax=Neohortaea acidophila TaxID=245834 RepID=A0A6A6PTJ7_9PEZI|nr:putative glycosyl hydrolase [Neohortaea acidophila]KAF2482547.1 putative glycosyl hydrolase [Neohortaea acidophila]